LETRTPIPPPKYLQINYEAMLDDDQPPLLRLAASRSVELNMDDYRRTLALVALREGATWSQIGAALGVTRQTAYGAFGRGLPDDGR